MSKQSQSFELAAALAVQKIARPADPNDLFAAMQGENLCFAFKVSSFEMNGLPGNFTACVWTDLGLEAVENDAWRHEWSKASHTDYMLFVAQ